MNQMKIVASRMRRGYVMNGFMWGLFWKGLFMRIDMAQPINRTGTKSTSASAAGDE